MAIKSELLSTLYIEDVYKREEQRNVYNKETKKFETPYKDVLVKSKSPTTVLSNIEFNWTSVYGDIMHATVNIKRLR